MLDEHRQLRVARHQDALAVRGQLPIDGDLLAPEVCVKGITDGRRAGAAAMDEKKPAIPAERRQSRTPSTIVTVSRSDAVSLSFASVDGHDATSW